MSNFPQFIYWKWTDGIFEPGVLERKIDDICARSGFDTISVSFHWMEAGYFDPRLQDAIRRACARLHQRGRRLFLDIDIRTEGAEFAKQFPDEFSGFAAFMEVQLDESGRGSDTMPPETVHRFGRTRLASVDAVIAAWAFFPEGDAGYQPASLADVSAACRLRPEAGGGTRIEVAAGAEHGGKRVLLFPHYTHVVPDLFSPNLYVYFQEMFRAVADLPLCGVGIDEWGHSPIFHFDQRGMYFQEVAYSRGMDALYARRYGRRLRDDLLHFRYGPRPTRLRVVNQYLETLRDGMAANEDWFYRTGKAFFGPGAFIGTHSTWLGRKDDFYLEVLQNGLHWWECRRDFAQTDEEVIMPIRLALAHKAGGAVWYNMFYSAGTERLETYFPETWANARFGGRTHQLGYECPNEKGVKFFADPGALELIWQMEERIAKLNRVQRASPDARILVLFGMEACTNWEFTAARSHRFCFEHDRLTPVLRFADALFNTHLCDLVPTSEIVNGSLHWQEGKPRYGNQAYDCMILLEPECMRVEVYDWLGQVAPGFPFYLFGTAQHLADASNAEARFAKLRTKASWVEREPPKPHSVLARLERDGIASNRFALGCVLQDGGAIFAAEGGAPTGNALSVDALVGGRRIQFEGEDFLAVRFGADGHLEAWTCGACAPGALCLDGAPVTLPPVA